MSLLCLRNMRNDSVLFFCRFFIFFGSIVKTILISWFHSQFPKYLKSFPHTILCEEILVHKVVHCIFWCVICCYPIQKFLHAFIVIVIVRILSVAYEFINVKVLELSLLPLTLLTALMLLFCRNFVSTGALNKIFFNDKCEYDGFFFSWRKFPFLYSITPVLLVDPIPVLMVDSVSIGAIPGVFMLIFAIPVRFVLLSPLSLLFSCLL